MVVINKFSILESRIQSLLEIIQQLTSANVIQADLRTIGLKNPIQTTCDLPFGTDENQPADSESNSGEEDSSGLNANSSPETVNA